MCQVGFFLGRISKYKQNIQISKIQHSRLSLLLHTNIIEGFHTGELDSIFPMPELCPVCILLIGLFLFFYVLTSLTKGIGNLILKCPEILEHLPVTCIVLLHLLLRAAEWGDLGLIFILNIWNMNNLLRFPQETKDQEW